MRYWERAPLLLIDFRTTRQYTARKEHECEECKGTIEPGSIYRYYSGKFGREDFFTFKMCMPCCSDWDAVLKIFDENLESWEHVVEIFGMLEDAVSELFDAGFIDESHRLVDRWLPDVEWKPRELQESEQLLLFQD